MSVTEDIKQSLDIVSVVSTYASLTKSGRNFKAHCPFHQERTASFYVFPDSQTWRCFGACGTGGDIFSFVMRQEKLEFGQALHVLADRAGITLQERTRAPEEEQAQARLRDANRAAALFYHNLMLNSPEASEARAYIQQRGISQETVRAFQLGYSLNKWDSLKSYLEAQGFATAELVAAGLMSEGPSGVFDRFRGRLMFPIWDIQGAVVGFGARTLDDSPPKYLNSSQTALFDKSAILYALDRAREAIRQQKQAVIVEGYMDVLTSHQGGFKNVVASMGTSLTEKQVGLLSRYTSDIVLALDADAAGQAATLRGLEVAPAAMGAETTVVPAWEGHVRRRQVDGRQVFYKLPEGMPKIVARQKGEIKVLKLPESTDPDSLIREDPERWRELVAQSIPMLDFIFKSAQERLDLTSPKGKAQAVEEIAPVIVELPNPVEQAHYLQRLATLVSMDERTLRDSLPRRGQSRAKRAAATETTGVRQYLEKSGVLEEYCLALLFRFDFLEPNTAALRADHFLATETRELFLKWQQHPRGEMEASLDEALRLRLQEICQTPLPATTEPLAQAALAQCIHRLEERRLRDLKFHHRLRFAQFEEENPGGKELAVLAYNRWQASQKGEEGAVKEVPTGDGDNDSTLVEMQEREVALNQQLHELMKQKPRGPTGSVPTG